jgi:hypothetical protein
MTDFEQAELNAFREAFPNAEQRGCFFRHIQKSPEILENYSSDSEFSVQIWQLVALAFVPPEDVTATFESLMEEDFFLENEGLLLDFVSYFERTWIGPWNRRKTARIPPPSMPFHCGTASIQFWKIGPKLIILLRVSTTGFRQC